MLDRDFAQNRTIYFCFADPVDGGGQTALARAALVDGDNAALDDVKRDLPAGGPALLRPAFRLPHRAGRATATCS